MQSIRSYTWLITLGALALLLAARSMRKDLGSRRQIVTEAAPTLQAGAADRERAAREAAAPPQRVAAGPVSVALRPSPWSIVAVDAPEAARASGLLRGQLRSPSGSVLAGTLLRVLGPGGEIEFETDRRGRFTFAAPEPGRYRLALLRDEAGTATEAPLITSFHPRPEKRLENIVVHSDLAEAPGAVGAEGGDATRRGDRATPQAGDAGVLDGGIAGAQLTAAGANTSPVPGTVRTTEGQPVGAFQLIVRRLRSGVEAEIALRQQVLDAHGEFELPGLPPGDYVVQAYASGLAPSQQPLQVPMPLAQAGLSLTLAPGGSLHGLVTEQGSRVAIGGASVTLDAHYDLGMFPAPVILGAQSDREGRFTLPGIGSGLAELRVEAPGHVPQVRPQLRMTAGQVTEVELALRPEGAPQPAP